MMLRISAVNAVVRCLSDVSVCHVRVRLTVSKCSATYSAAYWCHQDRLTDVSSQSQKFILHNTWNLCFHA